MKRFFTISVSAALIVSGFGCGTNDNSNSENLNTNLAAASETAPVNAETPAPDVPVPTFTDADTALAEGNKYLNVNATEKAVDAYKQAIKLNPDLAEAYFRLGIAHSLLENERESTQTPDAEPSLTPAKKGKKEAVKLTESEKAFENAVKAYDKIIRQNSKDDAAYFNLGRSYNKLNKDKEAEKALRQAVKLKPEDGEYQTEFGAILVKLANYEEAIPVLKKAVSLDETNSQAAELLEKAEAGKKRIDFGIKPKTPEAAKSKDKKSKSDDEPIDEEIAPPPLVKPTTK